MAAAAVWQPLPYAPLWQSAPMVGQDPGNIINNIINLAKRHDRCPRLVIGVGHPWVWVEGRGGRAEGVLPHDPRYPAGVPGGQWVRRVGPQPHTTITPQPHEPALRDPL